MEKFANNHDVRKKYIGYLVLAVALFAGIALLYAMIRSRVTDSSVQSMEELALHDKVSIVKSVEYRWEALEGAGMELRQAKCQTIRELLDLLHLKEVSMDCIDLALVDENENIYFGSLFITQDELISKMCSKGNGRFVERYDGTGQNQETRRECLMFGVEIPSFSVEGNSFSYLVCRYHISTLENELKIDSYNGAGQSSVFDTAGNYIVHMNRSQDTQVRNNFYANMEECRLDDGMTVEKIRNLIAGNNEFKISLEDKDGRKLMIFTPLDGTDWYFIMSVRQTVFEKQSIAIMRIVLLILTALSVMAVGAVFLILRSRNAVNRAEMEQNHREKLSKALELAEQASKAKTVFLNNMSHDIRTPMNAIIGFTALADAHIDEKERVRDYLAKITQASNHLLSLINDVLDMSRIESGKMVIDEKPENFAGILQNIRDIIQTDIQSKQLELHIDMVDLRDEDIFCDRLRLNQVLLNLLSNAMKFTPEGGEVFLRLVQKEASKPGYGAYEISVKDMGIGMSPEFVRTIFEPFTRERTSTVSGIQGTGLGMAITKNIVDMMGGEIRVESEQGKGTEFTVSLEFRLQEGRRETEESVPAENENVSFRSRRLLLVEDNEINREIAEAILEDVGFVIETAENGRQAVEAVARSTPGYYELVLMDILMPVMDGHEASRAIRKLENPALANIPIIAMTANAFEEDRQAALDAGMNAHVGKPIDVPVLLDTLKKFIVMEERGNEVMSERSERGGENDD